MTTELVTVKGLSHRYTRDWAVKDLNLTFDRKGIMGLLGSNGAGKSTLMNIMCGVLYPTVGDVLINGISIRKNPREAKQQIGFLPQQAPLHTELTIYEYLIHCAELRNIPSKAAPEAVNEAMAKCGIAHFKDRLIGNLSGGYRQRCGLAQAIIHKPMLVVLDEPTNGLDPNQILAVRELIHEIADERTVILSTHIMSEVQAICDEIKMIELGSIVFEGTIDEFANVVEPHSLLASFENAPDKEALLKVPGIEEVEVINDKKRRLGFNSGGEVAEHLIDANVAQGWRLRELSFERSTLENVFARLSRQQAA